jgi:gamma-glutamylcysteine synthetase
VSCVEKQQRTPAIAVAQLDQENHDHDDQMYREGLVMYREGLVMYREGQVYYM